MLFVVFVGAACEQDVNAPAREAKKKGPTGAVSKGSAQPPASASPKEEQESGYSYTPVGKRDPFLSYLAQMARVGASDVPQRRLEETEMFELEQYRLTAIITGTARPNAMVEDPENRGHVLRVGSRLGKHGGRVTRISSRRIVVTEEVRDAVGKRVRVTKTIALPADAYEREGLLGEVPR